MILHPSGFFRDWVNNHTARKRLLRGKVRRNTFITCMALVLMRQSQKHSSLWTSSLCISVSIRKDIRKMVNKLKGDQKGIRKSKDIRMSIFFHLHGIAFPLKLLYERCLQVNISSKSEIYMAYKTSPTKCTACQA